ncbi:MAG: hypothetical protein QOH90_232 [Actinomycetota bacterium]|nr:hypothetical protein [Actinomycetota bacterium]
MRNRRTFSWTSTFLLVGVTALLAGASAVANADDIPAQPIPQNPNDLASVPHFIGHRAHPHRVHSFHVPQNPFMAPDPNNNIHNDAYMTDAYRRGGPLGRNIEVTSTDQNADCASVTFDRAGRIVTVCVGAQGPRLMLMDAETLATKATFPLPPRSGAGTGSGIFNDFSGGGYFYLDHKYRAVIPTTTRQIWVVRETKSSSGRGFETARTYDLSDDVPVGEALVSVLPDWSGRLWFIGTKGTVGTVGRRSGRVRTISLDGEANANSFAVDKQGGVYIVTDHALYRFDAVRRGRPKVTWRARYDRGSRVKPGQASQGSGTTPTVIGRRYVAITDNADPRMHVLVYERTKRRAGARLVCKEPVFRPRHGNTDQSLIAVGHSLIVENNYGYSGPTATRGGATTTRGIARVRFSHRGCKTAWVSRERAPSVVPKASLRNGLIYTYTKPPRPDDEVDAWYLTAINYRTGRTVFKKLAGTGLGFNNNYAPVTLGPGGAAYVGALGGLVRLSDRP